MIFIMLTFFFSQLLSSSGKIKLQVHSPKKQLAVFKKPPAVPNVKPVQKKDRIIVHEKENMPLVHDGKGDGPDAVERVSKPRQNGVGRPPREVLYNSTASMSAFF